MSVMIVYGALRHGYMNLTGQEMTIHNMHITAWSASQTAHPVSISIYLYFFFHLYGLSD